MDTLREDEPAKNHPGLIGVKIDRFVIVEKLGAGGMGEVFLAKDPQLNRQVALKLLKRLPSDDDRAMGRLLGEARAMAQVSHPNVVSVFDAGMHGEQPWVAMEWIRGATLREWLSTPHPWLKKLEVMIEVGKGLQAAHDAGLVHRDLKPENVLIGENGRIAVTDFGLAHGAWAEEVRPELATPTPVAVVAGTPGYMAPEQSERRPTDARTDQFAFATTAYEALAGKLPPVPFEVPPGKVPARTWRAIERALSPNQKDRFGTMGELLAEMEVKRPAGLKMFAVAAAGVAAILAASATWVVTQPKPCDTGPKLIAGTWNPQRKQAVEASLNGSAQGSERVVAQLEAYVQRWLAMEQQSCEATRAGSQSAALLDLRMGCLRQRLSDLDAVVTLLASHGTELSARADQAVAGIAGVDACADLDNLGGRQPVPAAVKEKVEALNKSLSRIKAMEDLGQYRDAVEPAKAQVAAARAVGYAPALAEALVELGRTQNLSGNMKDAEPVFDEAVNTAEIGRDDRLRARARLLRAQQLIGFKKLDEASRELKAAAAVVQRVGAPALSRDLKVAEADLLTAQGQWAEALKAAKDALDIVEKLDPPDERQLVSALGTYAFALVKFQKLADAGKVYERAIGIAERVLGPKNPGLAKLLGQYMAVQGKLRKLDEARALHVRAQAIITESLGPEDIMMGDDLYNWGITLMINRDVDGAQKAIEASLAVRMKKLSPDHPNIASCTNILGVIAANRGQYAEAAKLFKQTLLIREKALGPTHGQVLNDLSDLAGAYSLAGQHVEALATFDESAARDLQSGSKASPANKASIQMGRGEELIQLFRFDEAKAALAASRPAAMEQEAPDLPGRQLLLESWLAWDGFSDKAQSAALAKEARPYLEKINDPEMFKALDELQARTKKNKRNTK